jgi:uncharacterized protein (DUF3820 family)
MIKGYDKKFTDDTILDFGKYAGKKLSEVPADYLLFIFYNSNCRSASLKKYISNNLEKIKERSGKYKKL